ncbi:B12-binding domain-containing radical SAM protein [Chloroflexota bacterium]
MTNSNKQEADVLIITGVSPVNVDQLEQQGMVCDPVILLLSMSGKNTYQCSIPSLGAAALGGYLRQQGLRVKIADFFFDEVPFSDTDIIGISSTFMSLEDVKRISDLARENNPGSTIVLGGPLSWSISPVQVLQFIPSLDYIIMQEGEQVFLEFINAVRTGENPRQVNSLAFRQNGDTIVNEPGPQIDISSLPMPAWDLMGIPSPKRFPVLPIETGRGCPYNCAYCSEVAYWRKPVRYHTADRVVEEILYNAEKLGITTFRIADSCFSSPPARCAEVCDAIYEKCTKNGIPVKWSSYARIENIDKVLLEKMKKSGCLALDLGLESGSTEVLHKMGRSYSKDAVVEVARIARDLDIITNFNVVVGFPGETQETVQETIDLINTAAPDTFTLFSLFLAPRTRAYVNREQFNIEGEGLSWKHDTMTSEEAAEAMTRIVSDVSNSVSFPAGEHTACYLASFGYSPEEIRGFYKAIARLVRDSTDKEAESIVKTINDKISNLSYMDYNP